MGQHIQVDKETGLILGIGPVMDGPLDEKTDHMVDAIREDELHKMSQAGHKYLQSDGSIKLVEPDYEQIEWQFKKDMERIHGS